MEKVCLGEERVTRGVESGLQELTGGERGQMEQKNGELDI